MADLPTDVRDRAEIAAYQAYVHVAPGPQSDRWGAVVDAVAEVLAAEQSIKAEFYADEDEDEIVFMEDDDEYNPSKVQADPQKIRPIGADHIIAERDALKARVAELEDRELQLQEQAGDMAEDLERERAHQKQAAIDYSNTIGPVIREIDALKARVDLLTTALTEIVGECDVRASPRVAYIDRARAALSATENKS